MPVHHQFVRLRVAIERNVESSSTILCERRRACASSPRLLGVTARPTIGVGNLNRRHRQDRPASCRCAGLRSWRRPRSRRAGRFDRLGLVGLARRNSGASLIAFFGPGTWTLSSFLIVPLIDADEAQLLHERVDAGLEDLGDQRAARVGLDRHLLCRLRSSPSAAACRRGNAHRANASSNSGSPTPVLADDATIGIRLPARHGLERSVRQFFRRSAASPRSSATSLRRRPR